MLIYHIGALATPSGAAAKKGAAQGEIITLPDAWVRVEDGIISQVGTGRTELDAEVCVDAKHRLVTPGLVDSHTHLVFGGWRQDEMALKLKGVPYLDILASGGGILSTVRATCAASEALLTERALKVLDEMLAYGTTTCEAKSGYGLCDEQERKQLRAIRQADKMHPIDIVPTFLGAHALPPAYKDCREDFVKLVCEQMIPAVAEQGLAEFCDVFCETGVFTAQEARAILQAGLRHGLRPKLHADEIAAIGGSVLAGTLPAVSAEHLIVCPDEGIERMAKGGTVACLLPCTSFYLGADYAPARKMVQAGVAVAMATDFNPGSCPCLNMQLVMNLGCLKYRLTPEEVLTAVTLNGAAAIGRQKDIGTLEVGKKGDLVIWDAPDLNYLCYRMGSNLTAAVIKNGTVVYQR